MSGPEYPVLSKDAVMAIKRMAADHAFAVAWILDEACRIKEPSFRSGDPYSTAFAEGRRFVGLLIAGAIEARPVKPPVSRRKSRQKANT